MAFKIERLIAPKQPPHNLATKSYICEDDSDIAKLPRYNIEGTQVLNDGNDRIDNEPCNYGSSATVISPFSGYVLSPNNTWKQLF